MKLNRLETHDRLLFFKKNQAENVFKGAEDCLKKNPLSLAIQEKCPYVYIFAHPRTDEDGVTKRMIWQPRLSKPLPQTNSYLFRAQSKTDTIEVCWLLPPREMWDQYKKENITSSELVIWSINQYKYHKELLAKVHEDDLSEEMQKNIMRKIIAEHKEKIKNELA